MSVDFCMCLDGMSVFQIVPVASGPVTGCQQEEHGSFFTVPYNVFKQIDISV